MTSVKLSSEQEIQILRAAAPLAPHDRLTFTSRVIAELEAEREVGDGTVHRICARVQRTLWNPPLTPSEAHRAQQLRKLS